MYIYCDTEPVCD